MRIEVESLRVFRGEFSILPPEQDPATPEQSTSAQLVVGCQFGLIDKRGAVIALGTASNSPAASATSVKLSDTTLSAFQQFFTYLESDIMTALADPGNVNEKRERLERLFSGEIPK